MQCQQQYNKSREFEHHLGWGPKLLSILTAIFPGGPGLAVGCPKYI